MATGEDDLDEVRGCGATPGTWSRGQAAEKILFLIFQVSLKEPIGYWLLLVVGSFIAELT